MKDKDLIDSYLDNPRIPEADYTHHTEAIKRMVNRQLIRKHKPFKFSENEHKWKFFDFALDNMPDEPSNKD